MSFTRIIVSLGQNKGTDRHVAKDERSSERVFASCTSAYLGFFPCPFFHCCVQYRVSVNVLAAAVILVTCFGSCVPAVEGTKIHHTRLMLHKTKQLSQRRRSFILIIAMSCKFVYLLVK